MPSPPLISAAGRGICCDAARAKPRSSPPRRYVDWPGRRPLGGSGRPVTKWKGPVGGGLSDAPAVLSLTVRAELGTLAPGAHAFCRVRMLALAEGVLELPALLVELRAAADPSERRDGDERGQIHQTAKHNFYECEAERQPSAFLFAVEVPRGCVRVASDLSS
ncbi:hypothetical protein T492DRAFT_401301 [Pavlovales sp. CCMP2436]|nr:hypothetical protein T492DRAFT_401301 [Pavlovales sp. CCMP2436]